MIYLTLSKKTKHLKTEQIDELKGDIEDVLKKLKKYENFNKLK